MVIKIARCWKEKSIRRVNIDPMFADAAATNREHFVVDTLGRGGGGRVSDITDLHYWFLADRRHLVRSTRFPSGSSTSGRSLDGDWIELRQVSVSSIIHYEWNGSSSHDFPAIRRISVLNIQQSRTPSCALSNRKGSSLLWSLSQDPDGAPLSRRRKNRLRSDAAVTFNETWSYAAQCGQAFQCKMSIAASSRSLDISVADAGSSIRSERRSIDRQVLFQRLVFSVTQKTMLLPYGICKSNVTCTILRRLSSNVTRKFKRSDNIR